MSTPFQPGMVLVDRLGVEEDRLLHGEVVVTFPFAFVGDAHFNGVEGG